MPLHIISPLFAGRPCRLDTNDTASAPSGTHLSPPSLVNHHGTSTKVILHPFTAGGQAGGLILTGTPRAQNPAPYLMEASMKLRNFCTKWPRQLRGTWTRTNNALQTIFSIIHNPILAYYIHIFKHNVFQSFQVTSNAALAMTEREVKTRTTIAGALAATCLVVVLSGKI